jgi:hypothetical protein
LFRVHPTPDSFVATLFGQFSEHDVAHAADGTLHPNEDFGADVNLNARKLCPISMKPSMIRILTILLLKTM